MMPPRLTRFATLALLICPRLAAAQSAAAGPTVNHEAETQYRLGLEAATNGRAEEARVHFQEAYAVDPKPATLRNLAVAEAALPNYKVIALRHLRQWLRGGTVKPAERQQATSLLHDLLAATGHVAIQGVPLASPNVVTIDGTDIYSMDQEDGVFDVFPGHHALIAKIGSGQTREVDVPAGATVTVRFDPVAPPAQSSASPPTQSHVVSPERPATPTASTQDSPVRLWLTVGLGVGAGVLLATGLYFGAESTSSINQAVSERNTISANSCVGSTSAVCADLINSRNTGNTDHTASIVLLTGSGVFAAGALASWFLLPKTRESGSVTPLVGSGTLGAQWVQTF